MASIVFTAPRHLPPNVVMGWAPGVLFVHGRPHRLQHGDYVYVCNQGRILYRARWEDTVWLEDKVTTEGEHKGPGWALRVAAPELPPREFPCRCPHGFRYLSDELW